VGLPDPERYHVTLLNLEPRPLPEGTRGFSVVAGNALSLDFPDNAFDVVFSNSVIEHVGSWHNQGVMAGEVRRVGRSYFVQTPAFWFPLEPHSRIPGFQFLPRSLRAALIYSFNIHYFPRKSTYRGCLEVADSTLLLTYGRFRALFPGATIHTERLFGLVKSYVALDDGRTARAADRES
jgi:hypothetical protein